MTSLFDKLNLRPMERRLAIGVLVVLIIVINVVWVWPYFDDYKAESERLKKNRNTLATARQESARLPEYKNNLAKLQGQGGTVQPQQQSTELQALLINIAKQNAVNLSQVQPLATTSDKNAFFEEKEVRVVADEVPKENLNKFLVEITASENMIRIRDLSLRPSASRQNLYMTMVVVGSYQKSREKREAATPSGRAAPRNVVPKRNVPGSSSSAKPASQSVRKL